MSAFLVVLTIFILWVIVGSLAKVAEVVLWVGVIVLLIAAIYTGLSWLKQARR